MPSVTPDFIFVLDRGNVRLKETPLNGTEQSRKTYPEPGSGTWIAGLKLSITSNSWTAVALPAGQNLEAFPPRPKASKFPIVP